MDSTGEGGVGEELGPFVLFVLSFVSNTLAQLMRYEE